VRWLEPIGSSSGSAPVIGVWAPLLQQVSSSASVAVPGLLLTRLQIGPKAAHAEACAPPVHACAPPVLVCATLQELSISLWQLGARQQRPELSISLWELGARQQRPGPRFEEQILRAASRGASGALFVCIEECALHHYRENMRWNRPAELQSRREGWQTALARWSIQQRWLSGRRRHYLVDSQKIAECLGMAALHQTALHR